MGSGVTPPVAQVHVCLYVVEDKLDLHDLFSQQVWAQGQLYACVFCRDWLGLWFKPSAAFIRVELGSVAHSPFCCGGSVANTVRYASKIEYLVTILTDFLHLST